MGFFQPGESTIHICMTAWGSSSGGSNQTGDVGEEDVYKQSFPFEAAAARHRSLTSHRDINRRDMDWYNTVC
jgi:hypothetical protein